MSLIPPKGKTVSTTDFFNWTHEQHNQKKCHCGKFACIGYSYRFGMVELLCYEHYQERISQCHLKKDTEKKLSQQTSEKKSKQVNQDDRQSLLL